MTNTALLNDFIRKSGFKKSYIAEKLGITCPALTSKINNKTEFKATEISELCNLLNIDSFEERDKIFFAQQVD